ncbi:MAG TPA: hypothetical protein VHV57_09155 [Acidimicrobiales bacterium]|jgi:hypothetical protein|nr:hypothetical protein [Acidimicrobiales bacterium]
MSDVKDVEMSLEDLFLSHEFGKVGVATAAPTLASTGLFPEFEAPLFMVPRAGSAAIGHSTTTHLRRNRTYAVMSGAVAAALVVAIGVSGATNGRTGKTGGVQALHPIGGTSVGGSGAISGGGGSTTAPGTDVAPAASSGNVATLASATQGSSTGVGPGTIVRITIVPTPGGNSSPPSSTAPAGTILAPVIHLVGQVVAVTGNTLIVTTGGLGNALPVASSVTGLLGNVSQTLSNVGNALVTTA